MVMMTLKGAKQYFVYSRLTAPRTVFNMLVQVTRAQSCANHVQHIGRLSRAICHVPSRTKGQLNYQV